MNIFRKKKDASNTEKPVSEVVNKLIINPKSNNKMAKIKDKSYSIQVSANTYKSIVNGETKKVLVEYLESYRLDDTLRFKDYENILFEKGKVNVKITSIDMKEISNAKNKYVSIGFELIESEKGAQGNSNISNPEE